ncbi:NAD(P)H-hydrate dehydratase [Thermodesulfatator autotrophicus]|uniref:Sugar kinase n=1 Tax=Thermodesulfatator autotrophicus TaxID=1795632 RepID=A0A177E6V3_9BACT|nr:NAD(P)H-hydrate dehydratase [Thermodesulfatator autotrophicus]OAG26952.1 sugar kinase [Thermodesulfatator autotrophicus]
MLAIVGTVPNPDFPLVYGEAASDEDKIYLKGYEADVTRGTPALIAAAIEAAKVLDMSPPFVYLVGDTGKGAGSQKLYELLSRDLPPKNFKVLVFHYLFPDVDGQGKAFLGVEKMAQRPVLVADAGFMYAAKMAGLAPSYDLFTPDLGELAFLADEKAPHPLYTRGFLFPDEEKVEEYIKRACAYKNAAKALLVKGKRDLVVINGHIEAEVEEPMVEALEAIGGTGDTLTGLVGALLAKGLEIKEACIIAAKTNRLAGLLAKPSPATQIKEIIPFLGEALKKCLS